MLFKMPLRKYMFTYAVNRTITPCAPARVEASRRVVSNGDASPPPVPFFQTMPELGMQAWKQQATEAAG